MSAKIATSRIAIAEERTDLNLELEAIPFRRPFSLPSAGFLPPRDLNREAAIAEEIRGQFTTPLSDEEVDCLTALKSDDILSKARFEAKESRTRKAANR